jgi:YfiH family protein
MAQMPTLKSVLLSRAKGVRHAFFTRLGGVSEGVYSSLNVGVGSKDNPAHVQENRTRCATEMGADLRHLLTCYQIHSSIVVDAAWPWDERPEADGVVTSRPGLVCSALAADCAPILLADPVARVVGAAHAGWKGALGGVVAAAVEAMVAEGAKRENIVAAVGPCIGQASYEVDTDFEARFADQALGSEKFFIPGKTADKRQFDLPGFVLHRLNEQGVTQAHWIGRDTCAEEEWFFSNRRGFLKGEPDYGRLLSAIVLEP